jgi:hypothetical protein
MIIAIVLIFLSPLIFLVGYLALGLAGLFFKTFNKVREEQRK